MKVTAYSVGAGEREFFEKHRAAFGAEMRYVADKPTLENADEAAGADCISVLSSVVISDEMYDRYKALGVRLAVTRTIGAEHMNAAYAEKIGMPVRSITYSAASVADYAIMMMLMVLRNVKPMMIISQNSPAVNSRCPCPQPEGAAVKVSEKFCLNC